MRRWILALLIVALYAAHQDVWFWRAARPLVFGFLPIGLFYHGCFSLAACILMVVLVRVAWPQHVEDEALRATDPADAMQERTAETEEREA